MNYFKKKRHTVSGNLIGKHNGSSKKFIKIQNGTDNDEYLSYNNNTFRVDRN